MEDKAGKYLTYGVKAVLSIIIVIVIFANFNELLGNVNWASVREWADSPVSGLKVWHLILILWIIGAITS